MHPETDAVSVTPHKPGPTIGDVVKFSKRPRMGERVMERIALLNCGSFHKNVEGFDFSDYGF